MKREIFLQLTNNCPNKCSYCFVEKGNKSFNKIDEFISFIEKSDEELIIHFTGGEPMLEFNSIKEIISRTKNNPKVTYSTTLSGFGLDNKKIDFIAKNIQNIEISLDGTKQNHNLNRGLVNDNHKAIVDFIKSGITDNYKIVMVAHTNTASSLFENFKFVFGMVKDLDKIFIIKSFNHVWTENENNDLDKSFIKITDWLIEEKYNINKILEWLNFLFIKRHRSESTAIYVECEGDVFINIDKTKRLGELNSLNINEVYEIKENQEKTEYDYSKETGNGIINHILDLVINTNRIYIGGACNNNCIHCLDRKFGQERKFEENLISLVEKQLPDSNSFLITGGEPLMHKSIFNVLSLLKNSNKLITVETNSRLLSYDKISEKLVRFNPLVKIPLIGPTDEIHDLITKVPGSFEQTKKGIENFRSKNGRVIGYIPVLKQNYDTIIDILALFKSLKVNIVQISYPILNCDYLRTNGKNIALPYDEIKKLVPKWITFAEKENLTIVFNNIPNCVFEGADIMDQSEDDHKIKKEFCNECVYDKKCAGIYKEYFDLFDDKLNPVKEKTSKTNFLKKTDILNKILGSSNL